MDPFDRKVSAELKQSVESDIHFTAREEERLYSAIHEGKKQKARPLYWMVAAAAIALFLLLGASFLMSDLAEVPSASPETTPPHPSITHTDVSPGKSTAVLADDGLWEELKNVELTSREISRSERATSYEFTIVNRSSIRLVGLRLYASYDRNDNNQIQGNPFRASLFSDRELAPGETHSFTTSLPSAVFREDKVNLDSLTLDLEGYAGEMKPERYFSIGRSESVAE
ncbi:hypothetical protein [Bhargavaea beijingensis]|uniref:DUF4352 domain-containing protein n=1 Tax=Bhargavaea beijingensis TaxID=426756 RepID=A0ABX9ZE39_9BACL|nr:hypothetical protein [Bhargavaea beijingensis]RSK34317.1 hypothetical protein EJA12_05135 [Bhargavaea beijingensis]